MTRHSKIIALMAASVGALIFSLPDQACKMSGGRKLAEAAGIIVERSTKAATLRLAQSPTQDSQSAQLVFFRSLTKKV